MEGIIRIDIEIFLYKFNLLSKQQHGLAKKSLVPQIYLKHSILFHQV